MDRRDDLLAFLDTVITSEEGFFALSLAQQGGANFVDQWYRWPHDRARIAEDALRHAPSFNVYFSSFLFQKQSRIKENVLPTRTIQADLDEADLTTIGIAPTVLIETSPGRHQAFWILSEAPDTDTLETLSRKLTYSIEKADHSGWPLGRTARCPFTLNHKYLDGPKDVTVVRTHGEPIDPATFELLPDADKPGAQDDEEWIGADKRPPSTGPNELLNSLLAEKRVVAKVVMQYNTPQTDRSAALWALMLALFRAGQSRDTVFHVARASANNKFERLRYHADRELAKDVLRAEAVAARKFPDPRGAVREMRRMPGPAYIVRANLATFVLETLKAHGDFIHTDNNQLWYLKRDTGRAIELNKHSEYFDALLDVQFGLNASEVEQTYIGENILAHTLNLPADTRVGVMSHYNAATNTLYLYTNARDVLAITTNGVTKVSNGADGILFQSDSIDEPFVLDRSPLPDGALWHEILLGDAFDNVTNMEPTEALALMRIWTLFIILRTAAATKPILALLAAPGSGKTTIMKRLYRLYYGRRRDLTHITKPESLNVASGRTPFLVLDNADTWERWLPDWLATAISDIDIEQRKLYTNTDVVRLKRQAIIGITAHNPKFGREDVAQRLLMLTFRKLPYERDEGGILGNIVQHRNRLWSAIVQDLQKVLAQPIPHNSEAPQFRIQDFSLVGLRIARAIGVEKEFRDAIAAINQEQKFFVLDEDHMLVAALNNMVTDDAKHARVGMERQSGVLYGVLQMLSGNPQAFQYLYRNASFLSKKLDAMQHPLSEVFAIKGHFDAKSGTKWWSVAPRSNGRVPE